MMMLKDIAKNEDYYKEKGKALKDVKYLTIHAEDGQGITHELNFKTIEQARKYNPYFKNFREVLPTEHITGA